MTRIVIPEVPSAGYAELIRCKNGNITDGPHVAAMANQLNMLAARRARVLAFSSKSFGSNDDTAIGAYGAFRSSPFARHTYCTVLFSSGLSASATMTVDGVNQVKLLPTAAGSATSPNAHSTRTFELLNGSGAPIAADTVHEFHWSRDINCPFSGFVIYESPEAFVTTGAGSYVDPSRFLVGAPVTGASIAALTDLAWTLYKKQGTVQFAWSAKGSGAIQTGTTYKNVLDGDTGGFASTSAGFYCIPYRQATLTGTTVNVTCWAVAKVNTGSGGRVKFSNSAGTIATITGINATTPTLYTATGTLDPTLQSDLVIVEHSDSAGNTVTTAGAGVFNLET